MPKEYVSKLESEAPAFRSIRSSTCLGKACRRSPGVILLREGVSIAAAIEELVLIWSASEADEWTNRLLWIPL